MQFDKRDNGTKRLPEGDGGKEQVDLKLTSTEEDALRTFIEKAGNEKGLPRFTYMCAPGGLRQKGYSHTESLSPLFTKLTDRSMPDFYITKYGSGEPNSPRYDKQLQPGEFLIEFYCTTGFQCLSGMGGDAIVKFRVQGGRVVILEADSGGVVMS